MKVGQPFRRGVKKQRGHGHEEGLFGFFVPGGTIANNSFIVHCMYNVTIIRGAANASTVP